MVAPGSAAQLAFILYVVAFVSVVIAFFSASWLVSDPRITSAKLERFGLWTHCFKSLADPTDPGEQTFFVGCRWIFDPFTKGYNEIRHFLLPSFIIATQICYSISFFGTMMSAIITIVFFMINTPDREPMIQLTNALGFTLVASGVSASISVFIFGWYANQRGWMPGYENNFFGWTFGVAVLSFFALFGSGAFYLVESFTQAKKIKFLYRTQSKPASTTKS